MPEMIPDRSLGKTKGEFPGSGISQPQDKGRNRDVIQSLWIGNRLSVMEQLSIRSFLDHGHPFHLYAYEEIEGVPEGTVVRSGTEILPREDIFVYQKGCGKGSPSAFSNFFRYKLLLERGGWWADLDVVCMRPLEFAEEHVTAFERQDGGRLHIGVSLVKVPPGSPVIQYCWNECQKVDKASLRWGQIGPSLFARAVETLRRRIPPAAAGGVLSDRSWAVQAVRRRHPDAARLPRHPSLEREVAAGASRSRRDLRSAVHLRTAQAKTRRAVAGGGEARRARTDAVPPVFAKELALEVARAKGHWRRRMTNPLGRCARPDSSCAEYHQVRGNMEANDKMAPDQTMTLLDAPDEGWSVQYERVAQDPFVRQKYDRARRLSEKREYLNRFLPEIIDPGLPKGIVVDIGPGPGEFLELCRLLGHEVRGVDAPSGVCGMGEPYLQLSRLMTDRQRIPVEYCGLASWIERGAEVFPPQSVCLINSQGSIEQACSHLMDGTPLDMHHDCRKLRWRVGDELDEFFCRMMRVFDRWLAPGGIILIYANGAANTRAYRRSIECAAEGVGGLQLVQHRKRLLKWAKQAAPAGQRPSSWRWRPWNPARDDAA